MFYVYGIVPAGAATAGAPDGLDDAPVSIQREGALAALYSELDGAEYEPWVIETRSGEVDWMAPRAVAHDRVLSWASDQGPVIPLPMYTSLHASADGVEAMLRDRAGVLVPLLASVGRGREYALRVYRVDAELRQALPSLSEDISGLEASAAAASPGQRYLLERKLEARAKEELRTVSQRVAGEIRDALSEHALEAALSPIPRMAADAPGVMVLNAAFLVAPGALRGFQERLTEIVASRQPAGFRFDFTGPWPPYHFASTAVDE